MTLVRCPLSIFCSRGTPPRATGEPSPTLSLSQGLEVEGLGVRVTPKPDTWVGVWGSARAGKGGFDLERVQRNLF